jgi:hypothetical protein
MYLVQDDVPVLVILITAIYTLHLPLVLPERVC